MTRYRLRTTRNNATGAITVAGDTFVITISEDGKVRAAYAGRDITITESGLSRVEEHKDAEEREMDVFTSAEKAQERLRVYHRAVIEAEEVGDEVYQDYLSSETELEDHPFKFKARN